MRLKLTSEQKRAAANDSALAYIESAPGSGKTTVAAERYGVIRYAGGQDGRGVRALSFARSARGELATRVRQRWGSGALRWPHKASTLDGLHCELVSHLLLDEEIRWIGGQKELVVLDSWHGQPGARPLTADLDYCRVARLNGRAVATAGIRIGQPGYGYGNKQPHEAILAQGICTHDEVRRVLRDALSDHGLRPVVARYLQETTKGLIVDEVFDGNGLDLDIVQVAVEAGIPTTLIGDPWQALYEFRGAEPELVPQVVRDLGFRKYPVTESFRFRSPEMRDLAEQLRDGQGIRLPAGIPGEADVVLASQWRALWEVSDEVLPLAFGQTNNRTDAALALLLDPFVAAHFPYLHRAGLEPSTALGLDPDVVRNSLPQALETVLDRLSGGSADDAAGALILLRSNLREIGARSIPALPGDGERRRVEALLAFSKRLGQSRLVPGLTVHQAKGREWDSVAVHLTAGQQDRLAGGLTQEQAGDRAIYVALTRARQRARLLA